MPRNYLVVVLPGIGGSVLAPDAVSPPIWQASLPNVPNILRDPQRLSLGEHEFLEPVGLVRTRKIFGVWTPIVGYDTLLQNLAALPGVRAVDDGVPQHRRLDAEVVAIPYDFRRSITEAAERVEREISQRTAVLWPEDSRSDPPPRIIFVAHSMGGLVARYWASQADNMRRCRALITLGTPHRGAPKALDILANGVSVMGRRIRRPIEVLREWPGVAELLPQYRTIIDASPGRREQALYPSELPLPWLEPIATKAAKVHRAINEAWSAPRQWPDMNARIGFDHGTLRRCVWDGATLQTTEDAPGIADLNLWDLDMGDGTVPAFSALPAEQDFVSVLPLRTPARHGDIVNLAEVFDLIESYEGHRPPSAFHGAQRAVGLGLDVEELALAGHRIEIAVRVANSEADVCAVAVWAEFADDAVRLDWDSDREVFTGLLPASVAGLHEVKVSAEAVPGSGDLNAAQLVEVVEDDGLE
ncbi:MULTISPECIES: alpha/beta fold hydrolase [Nocardia]|uniref:alpha/beta fold hydrolase n=1 Tax=Nocardia TaxID=1817 RepID=UPI0033E1BA6B